jgi:hypothetical protein
MRGRATGSAACSAASRTLRRGVTTKIRSEPRLNGYVTAATAYAVDYDYDEIFFGF